MNIPAGMTAKGGTQGLGTGAEEVVGLRGAATTVTLSQHTGSQISSGHLTRLYTDLKKRNY